MKPAIRVDKISKCYLIGRGGSDRNLTENIKHHIGRTVRGLVGGGDIPPDDAYWALREVSFEVQPGEVIGFVGRNGAGKSTLLKILSRIVEPTSGRAEVRGRLGSLLEVGTGFHPELNGRENIYLNGSILGMSRKEIKAKFDEIVAFADMDKFLDTPVKRYSSGMFVRLAFAIAAHLQPEVLIVDEVLAVGDAQFQKKCLGKMRDVSQEGRTILFVSHDMSAVRRLCTRAILMSKGEVAKIGPTSEVVSEYLARESVLTPPGITIDLRDVRRKGNGASKFTELMFDGGFGAGPITSGGPLHAKLSIHAELPTVTDSIAVTLSDRTGMKLIHADTIRLDRPIQLRAGTNQIELNIRSVNLQPGTYTLGLWMARWPEVVYDSMDCVCDIEVAPNPADGRVRPVSDGTVRCDFDLIAPNNLLSTPETLA
jgi:lipopolysaccharide transport system ATP-binding protein